MKLAPRWLSPTAKEFWREHASKIDLTEANKESFAVLCQTYADYRAAEEYAQKKTWLALYVRQAKMFGLISPSSRPDLPTKTDDLENLING